MPTNTIQLSDSIFNLVQQRANRQAQTPDAFVERLLSRQLQPRQEQTQSNDVDQSAQVSAIQREKAAYIAMHAELWQTYPHQHVAIHEGRLVDHDTDFSNLLTRIEESYTDQFVWMTQVEAQPIQRVRIPSVRVAR